MTGCALVDVAVAALSALHTHTHTRTRTHAHTLVTDTFIHAQLSRTHARTHTHACANKHTHTDTHTHTHTHHTHTPLVDPQTASCQRLKTPLAYSQAKSRCGNTTNECPGFALVVALSVASVRQSLVGQPLVSLSVRLSACSSARPCVCCMPTSLTDWLTDD